MDDWTNGWHPSFLVWFQEVIEVINLNSNDQRRLDRLSLGCIADWQKRHNDAMSVADAVIDWMKTGWVKI